MGGYARFEFIQIHEFFIIYNNDAELEDMTDAGFFNIYYDNIGRIY